MTVMPLLDPLTERELDVLRLIAEGLTNRQIGERLIIGTETVRWYTKQIYSKMGVHSRTQASMRARDLGLLKAGVDVKTTEELARTVGSSLPAYHNKFVGRQSDLAEIQRLLTDSNARLITITGPGGVGKTRLSVEATQTVLKAFPDGVIYLPVLTMNNQSEVLAALARQLGLRGTTALEDVIARLSNKQALILFDNFDRIANGADLVTALLDGAQALKLLITSRTVLNLQGEWVRQLEGMNSELDSDAMILFVDRVQQVRQDFVLEDHREAVETICRMVQGMPLALELAAAWVKMLTVEDVAGEIQRNLDFLTAQNRDVSEHHRSIRAVFDYSWEQLSDVERRAFRRLSVFRGGFGLGAAQQVAGASVQVLMDLAHKSLLYRNTEGLYQIHELLRQYAQEKLVSSDAATRSERSNTLIAWTALFVGDFSKVRSIAEQAVESTSDNYATPDKAFGMAVLGVVAAIDEDYAKAEQLCRAAMPLIEDDPISELVIALGLAIVSCGKQDYMTAHSCAREGWAVAEQLRVPAFLTLMLPILAIVRAHDAEPEAAVELLGLAEHHQASIAGWMTYWPLYRQFLTDLRAELDEDAFDAAWERGRSLDLSDAITP